MGKKRKKIPSSQNAGRVTKTTAPAGSVQIVQQAERLWRSGRKQHAKALLNQLLQNNPKDVHGLHLSAVFTAESGDPQRALDILEKTIKLNQRDPNLWLTYGKILILLELFEKAEAAFGKALKRQPNFPQANNGLGMALSGQERHEEAVKCYRTAIKQDERFALAYSNLGAALLDMDKPEEAINPLKKAIEIEPKDSSAYTNLGKTLIKIGDLDAAISRLSQAKEISPDDTETNIALAFAYIRKKSHLDAVTYLRISNDLLKKSGRYRERDLRGVAFGLADTLHCLEKYDEAFAEYERGNAILKHSFDREAQVRFMSAIKEMFPEAGKNESAPPVTPVFIVGLPRQGKTILEQILTADKRVIGVGEGAIVQPDDDNEKLEDSNTLQTLANIKPGETCQPYFIDKLDDIPENTACVISTRPNNFYYLGFVKNLYPNSKIIVCKRDPIDTLLACYFKNFKRDKMYSWTNNFEDLIFYYTQHQDLLDHWKAVGIPMLEVAYEDLVNYPEDQSRRVLEYLGLDGECRADDFTNIKEKNRLKDQEYSEPLSGEYIGLWKKYEAHITPLVEAYR